jgi:hypothetical protein
MKLLRSSLLLAVLTSILAIAQSEAPKSDAQKSFDQIKTLAGSWKGKAVMSPPMEGMDKSDMELTMRVTSRGNSLVHEMRGAGTPDDPAKYDHPVTMFYVDGDRLYLTHYCDAGNRPRMTAKLSPDGKTIDFDFIDMTGPSDYGHMQHAAFTFIDANHHIEEWTFLMPGDKLMHARMDLVRTK